MVAPPRHDAQAVREVGEEVAHHDLEADVVQASFRLERREEPAEPLAPRVVAEIVEAGELARLAHEPLGSGECPAHRRPLASKATANASTPAASWPRRRSLRVLLCCCGIGYATIRRGNPGEQSLRA